MVRASNAHAAVNAYWQEIQWGEREVFMDIDGEIRFLDIADVPNMRAIEYKTGYAYRRLDIKRELALDAKLVQGGWDITWVFEGRVAKPLLDDLARAGIKVLPR